MLSWAAIIVAILLPYYSAHEMHGVSSAGA